MLIKLKSDKHSPWGLFNDRGDVIVWLVDANKVVQLDENCLGPDQINAIKSDIRNNVLLVKECAFLEEVKVAPIIENFPSHFQVPAQEVKEQKSFVGDKRIDELLAGKVSKVLEKLDIARKDKSLTADFFQAVKQTEKMRKCRKTVLEVIIEIAIEKLAEQKTVGIVTDRHTHATWLSNQYENLIELTYEEEKKTVEAEEEEEVEDED